MTIQYAIGVLQTGFCRDFGHRYGIVAGYDLYVDVVTRKPIQSFLYVAAQFVFQANRGNAFGTVNIEIVYSAFKFAQSQSSATMFGIGSDKIVHFGKIAYNVIGGAHYIRYSRFQSDRRKFPGGAERAKIHKVQSVRVQEVFAYRRSRTVLVLCRFYNGQEYIRQRNGGLGKFFGFQNFQFAVGDSARFVQQQGIYHGDHLYAVQILRQGVPLCEFQRGRRKSSRSQQEHSDRQHSQNCCGNRNYITLECGYFVQRNARFDQECAFGTRYQQRYQQQTRQEYQNYGNAFYDPIQNFKYVAFGL